MSTIFNNPPRGTRLQPNEIKASSTGGNAFDISYNFVDSASQGNAGHVYGITNNLDTTRSQTFGYDPLNRIVSAQTTSTHATSAAHCWEETYTVDAWGNLITNAATTNPAYTGCLQESGFTKTADNSNHLSGFGYDVSGNTLNDGVVTNYVWDGESQLKSAAGVTYSYDGQGRRATKVGSKFYWYGSGGEILAETNASGATTNEYIFFGGKRIALLPAGSTAQFYAEDLLGSSRVVTTNTGILCYDADFYPYGGERTPYTNTCTQNAYKFEGKERDAETGNDDFGARYYSNRFGRWLSADWSNVPAPVPYANLTNPQTLNLYSMVADDPESFADLDGHFSTPVFGEQPRGCSLIDHSACEPDDMAEAEAKYNENVREAFAQADAAAKAKQAAQNQTPSVETATRRVSYPTDFEPTSGSISLQQVEIKGEVNYHGHSVSDPAVRQELMEISFATGRTVDVTSGDRNFVPKGGAKNSEHLKGDAADFHIHGLKDSTAFGSIMKNNVIAGGFKLLQHGPFTATEGPHLHLDRSPGSGGSPIFVVEGLTRQTKGMYSVVQP